MSDMSETRTSKLFVKGNADIVNGVLSKKDGGVRLDQGAKERIAAAFPGNELEVATAPSHGFAELRAELEAGTSELIAWNPDIVILSLADDVSALAGQPVVTEDLVAAVRDDLVGVVEAIKHLGAHVLVANVSTYEPTDTTSNYHGVEPEPFSLRAHRLDLMLVGVSHSHGVSVIDVDRLLAELGAEGLVKGPAIYDGTACGAIADEVVRILEDYGFFDDRPLVAQVGAARGGS